MKTNLLFTRIDISLQVILIALDAFLLIGGIFNHSLFIFNMLLLLFIGVYQWLLSAPLALWVWTSADERIKKWRKIHFFGSLCYVVLLFSIDSYHNLFLILGLVLPHFFALVYTIICWLDYRGRRVYVNAHPTKFAI